jgi:tight adherence protein C
MNEFLANDAARIALRLLLFVAVTGVAYGLTVAMGERRQVRGRLVGGGDTTEDAPDSPVQGLRAHDARGAWVALVTAIENAGIPLVDTKDETLRSRLVAAGYRQEYAPRAYSLLRLGLVVGLPIGIFGLMWIGGQRPSLIKLYVVGMVAALAGLYLPSLWVRARAARRQREIINGFPDALDLMLVCVEAGLALESAFDRVGKEVTLTPGQSWSEKPGDVHTVSRNASNDKPAKFVVFFLKDEGKPAVMAGP